MKKRFLKYVSLNVLATLGVSLYLFADTYFISKANGSDGITALNICLPVYAVLYAIGSLIGIGSATRYAIKKAAGDTSCNRYFSNSILWSLIIGIPLGIIGFFFPDRIMTLFGADAYIVSVGTEYARVFMTGAPVFIVHFTFSAFVRNDNGPGTAMLGTFVSALTNVILDYIFAFPLGMRMVGCAVATVLAPALNMVICSTHFFRKNNTLAFVKQAPSLTLIAESLPLGISAFIGELSSGVTTTVFNFLLFSISGNTAIAAYGVIANCALVGLSVFNGVAQGSQPLASEAAGKGDHEGQVSILKYGIMTSLVISTILYAVVFFNAPAIVRLFNSEGNAELQNLATGGIVIYFLGYFFAGINVIGSSYFSATDRSTKAFTISISRGLVAIVAFAFILSGLFGINGIWMAFPAAELATFIMMLVVGTRKK